MLQTVGGDQEVVVVGFGKLKVAGLSDVLGPQDLSAPAIGLPLLDGPFPDGRRSEIAAIHGVDRGIDRQPIQEQRGWSTDLDPRFARKQRTDPEDKIEHFIQALDPPQNRKRDDV